MPLYFIASFHNLFFNKGHTCMASASHKITYALVCSGNPLVQLAHTIITIKQENVLVHKTDDLFKAYT